MEDNFCLSGKSDFRDRPSRAAECRHQRSSRFDKSDRRSGSHYPFPLSATYDSRLRGRCLPVPLAHILQSLRLS